MLVCSPFTTDCHFGVLKREVNRSRSDRRAVTKMVVENLKANSQTHIDIFFGISQMKFFDS